MVGDIPSVGEYDQDEIRLSSVIDPVRNSGRENEEISLSELADLLVLVSERGSRGFRSPHIGLVSLWTAGNGNASQAGASDNEDEFRSIRVSWLKHTSRPDCMADHIDSGALELRVVLVPHFGETGLRLRPANGLVSSEILETTGSGRLEAVLLPHFAALELPRDLLNLSEAGMDENC